MRTAIFLGLTAIADAINKDWLKPEAGTMMLIIILSMMLMDVLDFIKNQFNNIK